MLSCGIELVKDARLNGLSIRKVLGNRIIARLRKSTEDRVLKRSRESSKKGSRNGERKKMHR